MILLVLFAFLAGVVTVLSPCILPLLPIILGSSTTGNKQKPLGIIIGFVSSFTFFTLFLSTIVRLSGISADTLRIISVLTIIFFGFSILIPKVQLWLEELLSKFGTGKKTGDGFIGGIFIGLSLGLLWTPCVGPILASVITLALSGSVNGSSVVITLAYALGTALPMFGIMQTGRLLFTKVPWLLQHTGNIQKIFGVIMIVVGIGIFFNVDRKFQTWVITTFPNYGVGLTKFEETNTVKNLLDNQKKEDKNVTSILPKLSQAPNLIAGGEWINSDPLTIESLKGKVVLVDFWTYTCINCIRTLPYVERWHSTYKDKGFTVIGVHTPEFEFEKNLQNVQKAVKQYKLTYPIMQDNNFDTWNNYSNRYWPAHYLIDKNGVIRYTHFGEGNYEETEMAIQELLKENGQEVTITPQPQMYTIQTKTPETYLGYARMERYASNERVKKDEPFAYSLPKKIPQNTFGYEGSWKVGKDSALSYPESKLVINYSSKDVFLVMKSIDTQARKVTIKTSKSTTNLIIDDDKLYELVKNETLKNETLTVLFDEGGVEVFAFTFG